MKNTIMNVIVVTALSFSGAALAAEQTGGKIQTPAVKPVVPASAVPPVAKPAVTAVAPAAAAKPATPALQPEPALKPSTPAAPAKAKPVRSKKRDLRHCLDLKTNAAIARCAGET